MRGLSLVVASGGHSSSRCAGLSLSWPLLLRSTGSRHAGSAIVAHRPSCSAARGILPDQGPNPCPLHWQADSQPLRHQGSPFSLPLKGLSKHKKGKFALHAINLFPKSIHLLEIQTNTPAPAFQTTGAVNFGLCLWPATSSFPAPFLQHPFPRAQISLRCSMVTSV